MNFEYSQSCVVEGTVEVETVVGTVGLGVHSLKQYKVIHFIEIKEMELFSFQILLNSSA